MIVGQAPYPHTCTFIKYDSHEDLARRPFFGHTYPLPSARSSRLLRWTRSIQHPRMTELLILVPPCIALMTPIMSPAFSVSVVLAFAVTQSILTTLLWLHVWKMSDDDDEARAGADDEYESDAVIEDATNTIHAAFAALAKSPAATSTFFHVVKGLAINQQSTAGALKHGDGDGHISGIRSEEVYSGCQYNSAADGAKLGHWPEFCGKHYTMSNSSSWKGYAGFRKLGGFRISVRDLEGADLVAQMV